MINLPQKAYIGRLMPKEAFYKQLDLTAAVKESFVRDIQRIRLEYSLSADSLNLEATDTLSEILILSIQLREREYDGKILENIARQNSHKLLFLLQYEDEVQAALYQAKLYKNTWQKESEAEIEIRGRTLPDIWQGFVEQIALEEEVIQADNLSLEERLKRQERINALEKEIAALERKVRKEAQPKTKFDLYLQLQNKRGELEALKNG